MTVTEGLQLCMYINMGKKFIVTHVEYNSLRSALIINTMLFV